MKRCTEWPQQLSSQSSGWLCRCCFRCSPVQAGIRGVPYASSDVSLCLNGSPVPSGMPLCCSVTRGKQKRSTSAHHKAATQAPTLVPHHLSTAALYPRNSGCYRDTIHRTRSDPRPVSSLWPAPGALRKSQKRPPSAVLRCLRQGRSRTGTSPPPCGSDQRPSREDVREVDPTSLQREHSPRSRFPAY